MAFSTAAAILTTAAVLTSGGVARNQVRNQAQGARTQARGALNALANRPVAPNIDDKTIQDARAQKLLNLQKRSGQASTNLSQNYGVTSNTFGG